MKMPEQKERRQSDRRTTDNTGVISFGREPEPCRVIDVSDRGAQVRIDGRRATRNLLGKRALLRIEREPLTSLDGSVVWVRPAVNGVYLGLSRRG